MTMHIVSICWLSPQSIRPFSDIVSQLKSLIETCASSMGKKIQWEKEGICTRGPTLFLFAKDGREIPSQALVSSNPLQGSVVLKLEMCPETSYSMIPFEKTWRTANGEIRVKESVTYSPSAVNVISSIDVIRSVVEILTQ